MLNTLKKITFGFRYGIIRILMCLLTPSIWRALNDYRLVNKLPRPSIKFIKEYNREKNRLIKGAEIGVFTGMHSKSILDTLNISKLYMIDIWENYTSSTLKEINITKYYYELLTKYKDDSRIEILRLSSMSALKHIDDNSLDFVYIDASHIYQDVTDDLECWINKVKVGGIISGHDIGYINDVQKAVYDFGLKHNLDIKFATPDFYFIKK